MSREALHEAKAELERQGRTMVQSADMGDLGELCYHDIPEIGSLVELLYLTELPPPENAIGQATISTHTTTRLARAGRVHGITRE
jgi:hypothetical protein